MVEKNKITDIKKADQDRRTELAMLGLLIEKYPREAKEKIRKSEADKSLTGALRTHRRLLG